MAIRNNQSQQHIRSTTLYSSSSKGSIFPPTNKPLLPGNTPSMAYNPYGLRQEVSNQPIRDSVMSKSTFMKKDENMDSFVKEVKEKFWKMERRLHEHEQEIMDLKSRGSMSVENSYSTEAEFKYQSKIQTEIERLRQQINTECIRKDAFDFKLNRFELELLDKFISKKQLSNKVEEIKDRTNHELQRVFDAMRNQLENSIHQVHDVNRVVFSRIEKDMSEMKSFIDEQKFHFDKLHQQVQLESQPIYPGNKKCFGGIKMVKYQERLHKINGNGVAGEEVIINECVYYLDRDGYLLDQGGYYLVNKMDQQIQLDPKQISILRKNNILF